MSIAYCVVSAVGVDEPGVVAALCQALTKAHCNISDMTQSNLRGQFASLFIVEKPADLQNADLQDLLCQALRDASLPVTAQVLDYAQAPTGVKPEKTEPFVISIYGCDRNDIVGTFATLFGQEKINIEDLRALQPKTGDFMIVYEVLIPTTTDIGALHKKLISRAKAMGLNLTLQHRDIFEAIHRVQVV